MWQRVTREQLHEQVWSVPISTLCEQYDMSDNGLRKVCRRLNVPVPPLGYWAKEREVFEAEARSPKTDEGEDSGGGVDADQTGLEAPRPIFTERDP